MKAAFGTKILKLGDRVAFVRDEDLHMRNGRFGMPSPQRKMNNYVSFLLEADAAKKRLAQLFESGAPGKTSHLSTAFAVFDSSRADRTRDAVSRIGELVLQRGKHEQKLYLGRTEKPGP